MAIKLKLISDVLCNLLEEHKSCVRLMLTNLKSKPRLRNNSTALNTQWSQSQSHLTIWLLTHPYTSHVIALGTSFQVADLRQKKKQLYWTVYLQIFLSTSPCALIVFVFIKKSDGISTDETHSFDWNNDALALTIYSQTVRFSLDDIYDGE